jgi:hypothetical protein
VAVKQEVRRLSGTSNKAKKPLLEEEAAGLLEHGEHDAVLVSTNDCVKRDGYDVRARLIEMAKRQLEVHGTADDVSGLPVEHDDGGPGAATASILRLSWLSEQPARRCSWKLIALHRRQTSGDASAL